MEEETPGDRLPEGSKEGEASTAPGCRELSGGCTGWFWSSLRAPDGPWPGIPRQVSVGTFPSKPGPLSLPGT